MTQLPPQMPAQPGPPISPHAPQAPAKGRGLAVAALVFGILVLTPVGPVCGPVAIVLGIISLATRRPGKGMAVAGIAIPVVVFTLIIVLMPTLGRAMELARRSICGANLNTIGKGVHIYLVEYEQSPPNIDVLIRHGTSPKIFQCPSADKGRKSDFFFHFPADEPPGNALVGCDLKGNHPDGRNVLRYDGLVQFIKGEAAFQAELALPHNAAFARELRKVEATAAPGWE